MGRVGLAAILKARNRRTEQADKKRSLKLELRNDGFRQGMVLGCDWKMKLGFGGFGDGR